MGTGNSERGQMAPLRWYTDANAESHGNRNGDGNAHRDRDSDCNTYCLRNRNSYGFA